MHVSQEHVVNLRSALSTLQDERDVAERRLAIRKRELETLKKREKANVQSSIDTGPSVLPQVGLVSGASRYARKKGVLAARAIRDGKGDAGYLRDLMDAALFGSVESALAIYEITRASSTSDRSRQSIECFVWLSWASRLDSTNYSTRDSAADIARQLDPEQSRASRELLGLLDERRSLLLTNPFDIGD